MQSTITYQHENSKVKIPLKNVRRVEKDKYDLAVSFLDSKEKLKKHNELLTSVYLQKGEIVAVENSFENDYYIAFSDNLNQEIMTGLLKILESESEF